MGNLLDKLLRGSDLAIRDWGLGFMDYDLGPGKFFDDSPYILS